MIAPQHLEVVAMQPVPAKQRRSVLGLEMAYRDEGAGQPIVLLHGNPTSSHLWRAVIPELAVVGRCIAPDLIGMGDSAKLPVVGADSYRFVEHARYLDGLLEAILGPRDPVILVVHDWGSALGFHWAHRHPERVRGLVYMEAIVTPLAWSDWPEKARAIFQGFRSVQGEEMVLERNLFLEAVLPASILRKLEPAEMEEYRRPFREPGESRRPMLTWPRQIPIDGEPADVVEIVRAYGEWLATSVALPKLFVNADPGSILVGRQREVCRAWPNQDEVTAAGLHFIQEDSGATIGRVIREWVTARGLTSTPRP